MAEIAQAKELEGKENKGPDKGEQGIIRERVRDYKGEDKGEGKGL